MTWDSVETWLPTLEAFVSRGHKRCIKLWVSQPAAETFNSQRHLLKSPMVKHSKGFGRLMVG